MLSQFDILNNKKCFYCGAEMNESSRYYLRCPSEHMNVWYDDFWYWEGFRIYFADNTSIRVYRSDDMVEAHSAPPLQPYNSITIDIPLFNVFNYSLAELEKKIKTYILFS